MCSFQIIISFLYNFRPVQDYFSSYETDKSVTRWGGGENPEKTTWHTHKQNLVCVTCDCKTDQLGSNLRRSVHCLGDGCCQSDIVFFFIFFSITPFYHMLCDVASIFAVRTFVVSQAFTMVLILIDNS